MKQKKQQQEKQQQVQRPQLTVDSVIMADPRVSPNRGSARAEAAKNLQRQAKKMIRMSTQESGGYRNLPIGLVCRHKKSHHDRSKGDTPTMLVVVVAQPGATVYTIATSAGYMDRNVSKVYLGVPTQPIDPALVRLDGVVAKFEAGRLPKLTTREFAVSDSVSDTPGIVRCGCKKGKCDKCSCAKAGRQCHSGCVCAKHGNCCNK